MFKGTRRGVGGKVADVRGRFSCRCPPLGNHPVLADAMVRAFSQRQSLPTGKSTHCSSLVVDRVALLGEARAQVLAQCLAVHRHSRWPISSLEKYALTDSDGFNIRPFAIELAKDEARSRQQILNHSSGVDLEGWASWGFLLVSVASSEHLLHQSVGPGQGKAEKVDQHQVVHQAERAPQSRHPLEARFTLIDNGINGGVIIVK